MKIVYCINSICTIGGTESVTITKANGLAEIKGNQVFILSADMDNDPAFQVNTKVQLVDLKVGYNSCNSLGGIIRFYRYKEKQNFHKKQLTTVLNEIEPDVVVSTGWSEKYLLPKIKYKRKPILIRELHSATHYRIISSSSGLYKFLSRIIEWYDYHFEVPKYDRFVVLTEEDKNANWIKNRNVVAIPNPVRPNNGEVSSCEQKVVISMGRNSNLKNFPSLVRAWKLVSKTHPDWVLKLYGPGFDHNFRNYIDSLCLSETIQVFDASSQIYKVLANASIFVFPSKLEGFGLVLVEAMSVGLPLVCYDCPCGPKDIITNGENGFLVPIDDEEILASKICWLIEHEDERKKMGHNALLMSNKYSVNNIVLKWMALFSLLIDSKSNF